MSRNWTPRDALIDVPTEHLYVWAPSETEARRIIETTAHQMLQIMDGAGYAFGMVEREKQRSRATSDPDAGWAP